MKILANENFPGDAVVALRQENHDVIWIREESPGSSDSQILKQAQDEDRKHRTWIDNDFFTKACRIIFYDQSPSIPEIADPGLRSRRLPAAQ